MKEGFYLALPFDAIVPVSTGLSETNFCWLFERLFRLSR